MQLSNILFPAPVVDIMLAAAVRKTTNKLTFIYKLARATTAADRANMIPSSMD